MNKLNILKAVKVVAGVAAVASAVAGTVVVVKAVRQYQADSVNAINKAETEGYETDEEAKEVTEKLQNDALKVVVASVGTIVVSGVFALIAHKASNMANEIVKNDLAVIFSLSNVLSGCIFNKIEADNLPVSIDKDFINSAYTNNELRAISSEVLIDKVKTFVISDDAKKYILKSVNAIATYVPSISAKEI